MSDPGQEQPFDLRICQHPDCTDIAVDDYCDAHGAKRAPRVIMLTIYDHPDDYPDKFIMREWCCREGFIISGRAWQADTLDDIRACVPPGSVLIPRAAADDPKIIESWM